MGYRIEEGVAILSIAEEPGRLTGAVVSELNAALDHLAEDGARAVVITGQGRGFPAGPPLSTILDRATAADLGAFCARIAAFELPVVAAMRGTVRDGALALALAARARVAAAGTRIGFSEIELGLCPYAGATQRLPRVVGARLALDLILTGRFLPAETEGLSNLFQAVASRNVVAAAADLARSLADEPPAGGDGDEDGMPGLADPLAFQAAIAEARRRERAPEGRAVVEAVEAAQLLPLDAGLAFEAALFDELRESDRAAALVHVARAERLRPVAHHPLPRSVAIFGESRMARGLALACLDAGLGVYLAERAEGGAARLIGEIAQSDREAVAGGRMSADAARARKARLSGGEARAMLAEGEIVIEASGVPLAAMNEVSELIETATGAEVPILLGSNVALHAGALSRIIGGRVLGAAFQPPPQLARLVELVVPDGVSPDAVIRSEALVRGMNKLALHVAPRDGCLVQTMVARFFAAAEWCVARGASPLEVDRALGWRTGPFAMMDREGMMAQPARLAAIGGRDGAESLNEVLLAAGRDGLAAGKGYYRYDGDTPEPRPDAEVQTILTRWRGVLEGPVPGAEETRLRLILAMVSAGLDLLETGEIARAGEIDLAAIHGIGMPRATGGPMKTAETIGLIRVRRMLEAFGSADPGLWRASPLLDEKIKNGAGFGD